MNAENRPSPGSYLELRGIGRQFGGVAALQDVSLTAHLFFLPPYSPDLNPLR